jgi:hypothetical protein
MGASSPSTTSTAVSLTGVEDASSTAWYCSRRLDTIWVAPSTPVAGSSTAVMMARRKTSAGPQSAPRPQDVEEVVASR